MSLLLIGGKSSLANTCKPYLDEKKIQYIQSNRSNNSKIVIDLNNINTFKNIPEVINKAIIFAGITSIYFCEKERKLAHKINFINTKNLINKLNSQGVKCLIISSSAVFSNKSKCNGEFDKKEPNTYYGILKSELEDEVKNNSLNCIVRLTKVILPETTLVNEWINNLKINKSIKAYNNLLISPISNLCFNQFVFDWIVNEYSGIYHLTSDNQLSYYELISYISKSLNLDKSLIIPIQGSENIIFNPIKSYLNCYSKHSQSKALKDELKIISNYYK